eukprot:jgi/Botrbrau1/628/Bobra.0161s0019.1
MASIGNLMLEESRLALTKCSPSKIQEIHSAGFSCDLQSSSGGAGMAIVCTKHALTELGLYCIVSVPIPLLDSHRASAVRSEVHDVVPDILVVGFLSAGWICTPSNLNRSVEILQELASRMAPAFPEAMQELALDVVTYFMPYQASNCPLLGLAGGTGGCAGEATSDAGDDRGPSGGSAPSTCSPSLASDEKADGWDTEGGATEKESKLGCGPAELEDLDFGMDKHTRAHVAQSGKRAAIEEAESRAESLDLGSLALDQDPFWLTFTNTALEYQFQISQAVSTFAMDIFFVFFALGLYILTLVRAPILLGVWEAWIPAAACVVKIAVMFVTPSWYFKHREVYSLTTNLVVCIGNIWRCVAFVAHPLATAEDIARLALRQTMTEPFIHATVCFGNRIRFVTAATIRTPMLLCLTLLLVRDLAAQAWGYSLWQAIMKEGPALLLVNLSMLTLVRVWEKRDREAFLLAVPHSAAAAVPWSALATVPHMLRPSVPWMAPLATS